MKTILQIISDSNIGGAGRSLINYLRYEDRSCFRSHVVLPRNSALKPEIEGMGIPIYEIDAIADKSMDVSAIAPLRQIIKEVKPDLIHTHGSMSGRIAAKLCGRKVIYTKHCAFPLGKLMKSIPGQCASKAMDFCLSDGAIAIGDSVREILLQSGVPDRKIHVLYNGVTPLEKPGKEQREQVRQEILDGTYETDTDVNIAMQVDYKAIYMVGEGHLTHDRNGFRLTGCDGKLQYTQKPQACYSLYADYYWYEIADCVCIGDNEVHYFLFPKKEGVSVAKMRLATEEMYKLYKARLLKPAPTTTDGQNEV